MGRRVSIYLKSVRLLESIKEAANKDGRSVSNYLVQLHWSNLQEEERAKIQKKGSAFNPQPKRAGK